MDINEYFYAWKPALFRSKTRGWTTLQRGIYRELIDEYMLTRAPLPNDDSVLADIARITIEIWLENKDKILTKFEVQEDFLYHEHCNEELDVQDKKSRKLSERAKKAAASRWKHKKKQKMLNVCLGDASPMLGDATGQDRTGQDKKIKNKKRKIKNSKGVFSFPFSGKDFQGKVIKLDPGSFNLWFQKFSNNGDEDRFRLLLQRRDEWYATQEFRVYSKWLSDTTKWLIKNHKQGGDDE